MLNDIKYVRDFDLNAKNYDKNTPLHIACENGNLDVIKYLVEAGADVNAKNNYNNTLLHIACENGHIDIVKYLVEICKVDVNVKNIGGNVPMHSACYEDTNIDIIRYLIEVGKADINIKDNYGKSLLYYSRENYSCEIIKYLEEHNKNKIKYIIEKLIISNKDNINIDNIVESIMNYI